MLVTFILSVNSCWCTKKGAYRGKSSYYESPSAARQLDPTVVSVQIHLLELVVLSMRVGNPSFFAPLNRAVVAGVTCTRPWRVGVGLQMIPTDAVQVCDKVSLVTSLIVCQATRTFLFKVPLTLQWLGLLGCSYSMWQFRIITDTFTFNFVTLVCECWKTGVFFSRSTIWHSVKMNFEQLLWTTRNYADF